MKTTPTARTIALLAAALLGAAHAAEWSDAAIAYSHGVRYKEPGSDTPIAKDVVTLSYVGGNALGLNFVNVDLLRSDGKNPANNGKSGAHEVYVVFQNTLSFGKLAARPLAFGPVRDAGWQTGFDFSAKNDAFGGAVFKLIAGPKLEFDVPGLLTLGLFGLKEWGNNSITGKHVSFDPTWRLGSVWQFDGQVGAPVVFKGWATYTGRKGSDGFGGQTSTETWAEASLLWDVGGLAGNPKKYYAGLGYQYIRNKFNNPASLPGTRVSAPSLKFEAHF